MVEEGAGAVEGTAPMRAEVVEAVQERLVLAVELTELTEPLKRVCD